MTPPLFIVGERYNGKKIFPEGDNLMNDKILVTYASRAGATKGVAEVIGKTLAEGGLQVEVLPMEAVKDLAPYTAVVAGSAIRDKKWLPEAMQFIQTHRAELNQKPFAAFLVCMTLAMPQAEKYRPFVADFMQPVRALVKPVSEGLFAGILDISKVESLKDRLMFKMSVKMGAWSEGDHRDWQAIQAWAEGLGPRLTR
jgi:menaquinone-dependent protoporphyrinogen oxidase